MNRDIPNTLEIAGYVHCAKCLNERPEDQSPREWASLEVGWTALGLQVWCKRHELNVMHLDFLGQKVAMNSTAKGA